MAKKEFAYTRRQNSGKDLVEGQMANTRVFLLQNKPRGKWSYEAL
jgi:hypothetical protein